MSGRASQRLRLAALVSLLAACATPPDFRALPADTTPPLRPPSAAPQATRYTVDAERSEIRFLVFREGPLAALGHNHVVQAQGVVGEIYLAAEFSQSQFWLSIPVAGLVVDAAAARAQEGEQFASAPDAEAIASTTKNMVGDRVLQAGRYPRIDVRSVALGGSASAPLLTVRIKLGAAQRNLTIPVAVAYLDQEIRVTAQFEIKQSDFGIAPFSVLGGAIRVADTVKVRLQIVAGR